MEVKKLHHLLTDALKLGKEKTFVQFKTNEYSFESIDKLSNHIAHRLQKEQNKGVKVTGIYMERSVDMLVAMLGILKAGSSFLPLEPGYPISRNNYIVKDSGMEAIIVQEKFKDDLDIENSKKIILRDKWMEGDLDTSDLSPIENEEESSAYVIYTSGSTGNPKGVEVPRRALANLLIAVQDKLKLNQADIFLAVTTICFDISILELFLPLYVGCKLIIAEQEIVADGNKLIQNLDENDVTIMQATPSTWQMILESKWKGKSNLTILCGGEALSYKIAMELAERSKSLWNMYGPTETCIWSMMKKIEKGDSSVTIGKPIENTYLYVLDEDKNLIDASGEGELYIGGIGVAKGYLNHPELTEKAFITNTYDEKCDIIYKTGDVVKLLENEELEYVQRVDFQAKVRGFRIELGEIEKKAEVLDDISQAIACVCVEEENFIVLFYKATKRGDQTNILAKHLREQLPHYMIPSYYELVDKFPLTPNKKVDRKALVQSFERQSGTVENVVERKKGEQELTFIQQELIGIWCEILKLDDIELDEDFLDLGGHSLLANRLTNRVNEEFEIELTIFDVVTKGMTILNMEKLVEEKLLEGLSDEEIAALKEE